MDRKLVETSRTGEKLNFIKSQGTKFITGNNNFFFQELYSSTEVQNSDSGPHQPHLQEWRQTRSQQLPMHLYE